MAGDQNQREAPREGTLERLAREKGIIQFYSVHDIINDVMEEFVEKLEKYKTEGMTEEQYTTAKDIRRRGKNRNAARNCRRRARERGVDLGGVNFNLVNPN